MTTRFRPVILIGAARSGTKLVRDLLADYLHLDRVPYDVNFIWRLGNETVPHDELPAASATPEVVARIRRHLTRFSSGKPYLVEKTVSNCLRVAFVRAVLPEAVFIHLIRDGRDVVESVYRQWLAPPSWSYVFKKARYFPFAAAWGYALSYARDLVRKSVSRGHQTGTWGPRYEGIDADLTARDLLEVCARQWVRSVERAMTHLGDLPADRVITVRYEDFVRQPLLHLERLARFLGIAPPVYGREYDFSFVSAQNIGKGFRRLDAAQQALILSQIDETLKRLDYLDDVKVVPASHEATWNSHASE